MYDHTKLVKESVWDELLQVLVNGVSWNNIAYCGASGVSCWRYLQEIQRRGKLKLIYEVLAKRKTTGRHKRILNLDKGYMSIDIRRKLRQKGTHVNMETRRGDYKHKKGPKFKLNKDKYRVRSLVDRTIA